MISKIIGISCLISFVLWVNAAGSDFAFPEPAEEDKAKQNSKKKTPVYIPDKCAENELLYPGDQENDWVCDCFPGFVYVPAVSQCHAVYQQGPCKVNEYLVMQRNTAIPACVRSLCVNGKVPYKRACYAMKDQQPCRDPRNKKPLAIGVNETTLEISCVPLDRGSIPATGATAVITRFGDDHEVVSLEPAEAAEAQKINFGAPCAMGSYQKYTGACAS